MGSKKTPLENAQVRVTAAQANLDTARDRLAKARQNVKDVRAKESAKAKAAKAKAAKAKAKTKAKAKKAKAKKR